MITEVRVTGYEIDTESPNGFDETFDFNKVTYRAVTYPKIARNPNVTAGALENIIEVKECYLITSETAQARADAILDYYMRRNTYSFKHVVSGQKLGDRASVSLPWGGTADGNILKMKISVTGITVSDTEFLID